MCPIYHFFIFHQFPSYISLFSPTCRYQNSEHENNHANDQIFDFEKVVYIGEFSNDEDTKGNALPSDLLRLVAQEERQILLYQKITKVINLGTKEAKKEVKIGTSLSSAIKKELLDLLQEFNDVFA